MEDLNTLQATILDQIDRADDLSTLDDVRVKALGKKGVLSERMRQLGGMSPEERQEMGPLLNGLKATLTNAITDKKTLLEAEVLDLKLAQEKVDVSLPVQAAPHIQGRIHPISQVIDELTAIFADMGFAVAEGPDIETDYYNFSALNFADDHPAREMHDTFFLPDNENGEQVVLRTHTSPVQIRTMEKQQPPIRIVIPGRTYRCDSDITHTPMFHQIEGLVIDKTSTIGHMKWVFQEFLKAFFEVPDIKMRFRPSYFPFTEPSIEVDVGCQWINNELRLGEGDDWMEILGCGMVHPNVLRSGGLDPDEYQGFAWGIGIDRIAMLKYGAPDLRQFFEGDIRWNTHYGFPPLDLPTLFGGLSS